LERLTRRLLLARQERLGLAEVEDDIAFLKALDHAVDEFALTSLILIVDDVPLGLAYLLDDHLFRRLRRNAPKPLYLKWDGQHIPDIRLQVVGSSLLKSDLAFGVIGLRHDGLRDRQFERAGLGIKMRLQVFGWAVPAFGGRQHRRLHPRQQDFLLDPFFPGDLLNNAKNLLIHHRLSR
jgi:hypothetical protein